MATGFLVAVGASGVDVVYIDDLIPIFSVMAIRTACTRIVMGRIRCVAALAILVISVIEVNMVPPGGEVAVIAGTNIMVGRG